METEIDIRISYSVRNSKRNLAKADELYRAFQKKFEESFTNPKLLGVHISKHESEKKKN